MNISGNLILYFLIITLVCISIIIRRGKNILSDINYWKNRHEFIHKHSIYMFRELISILNKYNIRWWLICGNLLGIVRDNQLILPFDDDIDIGVDIEQFNEYITEISHDLNNIGIYIKPFMFGYKIYTDENLHIEIDVFVFSNSGDKYQYNYDEARQVWPTEYFYIDENISS